MHGAGQKDRDSGDENVSEPEGGGECLILDADDCACCVANNGDGDLSEPEDAGVECLILGADDCACCVAKNGDSDLFESEDDREYNILDDDCACCATKNEDEDLS